MEFNRIDEDIGEKIGDKYKIKKTLGQGNNGKVFLVNEINTNKEYAIKMSKKENCKITKNEIRILKQLSQKRKKSKKEKSYIIDIIDDFQLKSKKGQELLTYIVLEYMKNGTLFDYFINTEKIISERYAKYIFLKILKGVQEIHKAGFCHLDLKFGNILLDEKYNPIICDFGFATKYSSQLECYQGSIDFVPLEILKNIPFDGFKADIFSLGVILFAMLTKRKVFYNEKLYHGKFNKENYKTYKDKYYQYIIDEDFKGYWDIINLNIELSDEFKKLFEKMISNNPEKRPSIDEILIDPWMLEFSDKNITEEETKILEENVFNEFKERESIIKEKYKKDNCINCINNIIDKINENQKNKSGNKEKNNNYFTQDFCVPIITEDNLNMKYYFKINGSINPKIFMNMLIDKLDELKAKDNDIAVFIKRSEKEFKIDIAFEDDNDIEMPEELINAGFDDIEEYKNAFHCQDLRIRIKLFKTNDGYLIKVYKKEGSFEEFNVYLGDIMKLIKELFE